MSSSLTQFFNSSAYLTWAIDHDNPNSDAEIRKFLPVVFDEFASTVGFDSKIKELVEKTNDLDKWWNIFSEMRIAYFILKNFQPILEFNVLNNGKLIDFKLGDGRLCDVASFLPKYTDPPADRYWTQDDSVIYELSKKVRVKIEKQGAELVIIDDIFSFTSKKNGLQRYFAEQAETTRRKIFEKHFGTLMDKWVFLTYVSSLTANPHFIRGMDYLKPIN